MLLHFIIFVLQDSLGAKEEGGAIPPKAFDIVSRDLRERGNGIFRSTSSSLVIISINH